MTRPTDLDIPDITDVQFEPQDEHYFAACHNLHNLGIIFLGDQFP